MMYRSNLVASIGINGKILHEDRTDNGSPTVYLPFGSEYSILLKNLNTRKASVKISIDGTDVLDGRSLILGANESTTLERFFNSPNKFKFIEKTEKISNHRGDRIDDGIVRVEYQFEQEYISHTPWIYNYNTTVYGSGPVYSKGLLRSASAGDFVGGINTVYSSCCVDTAVNDSGITTKGSYSSQKFETGTIGILEPQKHVITLMLKGKTVKEVVVAPVLSREKIICEMCGRHNKRTNKFCPGCGTAIV